MQLTVKYINRLTLMVHLLRNHDFYFPKVEFDLNSWSESEADEDARDAKGNPKSCGTAACAVGSAMQWPPFQAMGFKHYHDFSSPVYKDDSGWDAVTAFFGITEHTAYKFFMADYYDSNETTADDVADRIEDFLRTAITTN